MSLGLKLSFFLILSVSISAFGQDIVFLSNGDDLHGEIKNLDQSVLTVETPYSDSDFKIEWDEVTDIISQREFIVFLSTTEKLYANLNSSGKEGHVILTLNGNYIREVKLEDVVILDVVEKNFEDRFKASVSGGYTLTKANDSRQFTARASLAYYSRDWNLNFNINTVRTFQAETDPIERLDGGLNFSYLVYKNWFASIKNEFLSNNEQQLDMRTTNTLAAGNLIIRTNQLYLSGSGGLTYNREDYSNEPEIVNSGELFFGLEFNAYDIGDLNFLAKLSYFPSITDTDRNRVNFNADLKYDFPYDFFIKLGYTLNYDSKPPNEGEKQDYVFTTTIGWEF